MDKTKSASLPELKRVIVAFGNRLTMAEELETALNNLLQGEIVPKALASAAGPQSLNLSVLGGLALEHYNQAKEHLRQGRWAAYGKALEELEGVLKEITRLTKEKQE